MDGLEALVESTAKSTGIVVLKDEQNTGVHSFVCRNNVFVALPTGYGKCFCFALLPLLFDPVCEDTGSTAICISPLMMEQRWKFSVCGMSSEYIGLQQDIQAMDRFGRGMIQQHFKNSNA